jgi:hypothetical protein
VGEHCRRNGEAERPRGLEIDRQLVLHRRLHGKIGRLLALEDAVDVAGAGRPDQARRRSTRLLGSRNFQAVDEGMTTAGLTSRSP